MEYTKEYFIEKLKAIPDSNWLSTGDLFDKENPLCGCLLYHCGVKGINNKADDNAHEFIPSEEALALVDMIDANVNKLKTVGIFNKIYDKYDNLKVVEKDNLWIGYVINDTASHLGLHPKQAILDILEAI